MTRADLENRLILFSIEVHHICFKIGKTELGRHLSQQMIRSATSPALNYGEAQGSESQKDFIHKLRICLKELRETHVALRIIDKADICSTKNVLRDTLDECNQLISIFVSSIKTAQKSTTH